MSSFSCPKCLSPRPEFRPLCKTCTLIEEAQIRQLAEEQAAATLAFFSNTDELTYDEAAEFETLTAGKHFGKWELEDTSDLLKPPAGDKKTLLRRKKEPPLGGGLGLSEPDEAPEAIAKARSGALEPEQQSVMDAHAAWMEMEEKALAEHKTRSAVPSIREMLMHMAPALAAGFAFGVGFCILLTLFLTGGLK